MVLHQNITTLSTIMHSKHTQTNLITLLVSYIHQSSSFQIIHNHTLHSTHIYIFKIQTLIIGVTKYQIIHIQSQTLIINIIPLIIHI